VPRKKTLEARLADLITDFGLDAVIQCMRFAEEMQRPRRPRKTRGGLSKEEQIFLSGADMIAEVPEPEKR
jgi:hypothetical protein